MNIAVVSRTVVMEEGEYDTVDLSSVQHQDHGGYVGEGSGVVKLQCMYIA